MHRLNRLTVNFIGTTQETIYRDHLLLSQFPEGSQLFKSNFPTRNRLMAALTDATIVIEAGETSGTLHQTTECIRIGLPLFIAKSVVDNPDLTCPRNFLDKPNTWILERT